jgi:hypothetical protein
MTRTDIFFWLAFPLIVVGVGWVSFGNPFTLQGDKLQEFAGYVIGLLLGAVWLFWVVSRVVMASPVSPTPPIPDGREPSP